MVTIDKNQLKGWARLLGFENSNQAQTEKTATVQKIAEAEKK